MSPVTDNPESRSRSGLRLSRSEPPDGERPMTPARIRNALGHFATGVTVITSLHSGGEPVGTTASAFSALSLDPPLLLVCLAQTSSTLAAVRAHGAFAINVLTAKQHDLSTHFARSGTDATWEGIGCLTGALGLPLLADALATLECALDRCVDGGDHDIVIGRLRNLEVLDGQPEPLLHYRGAYASLVHDHA